MANTRHGQGEQGSSVEMSEGAGDTKPFIWAFRAVTSAVPPGGGHQQTTAPRSLQHQRAGASPSLESLKSGEDVISWEKSQLKQLIDRIAL